jgi:hypothetical protein
MNDLGDINRKLELEKRSYETLLESLEFMKKEAREK